MKNIEKYIINDKYEDFKKKCNLLEPVFSFESVHSHFFLRKEYYNNLNNIFDTIEGKKIKENFSSLEELLKKINSVKKEKKNYEIWKKVEFFAGGIINHDFFFSQFKKNPLVDDDNKIDLSSKIKKASKDFYKAIEEDFLGLNNFEEEILNIFSDFSFVGWIWVFFDLNKRKLSITNSQFNNSLFSFDNLVPLIVIDCWEHSYYLDYLNQKKEYIYKLLNFIIDWKKIGEDYNRAISLPFSNSSHKTFSIY